MNDERSDTRVGTSSREARRGGPIGCTPGNQAVLA
jgi:hypothetical protein